MNNFKNGDIAFYQNEFSHSACIVIFDDYKSENVVSVYLNDTKLEVGLNNLIPINNVKDFNVIRKGDVVDDDNPMPTSRKLASKILRDSKYYGIDYYALENFITETLDGKNPPSPTINSSEWYLFFETAKDLLSHKDLDINIEEVANQIADKLINICDFDAERVQEAVDDYISTINNDTTEV